MRPLLVNTTEVDKVDEFRSITAPVEKWVQFEQRDRGRRRMSEKPAYVVKEEAAN